MQPLIYATIGKHCRLVLFAFALGGLGACANDDTQGSSTSVDLNYKPTVFISFESGPNAGRYQYIVDESQNGKIELKYNSVSDVTFLELRGLISLDGRLRLDELRRFTKGELKEGENSASTWRAKPILGGAECGVVNLRDHDNSQAYNNGFGKYQQCGETHIDLISGWKNSDDSVTKVRITKGRFSDRIQFDMSMDNAPFKRFQSDIEVEFDVLEVAARF